jgi:hypothetical protein
MGSTVPNADEPSLRSITVGLHSTHWAARLLLKKPFSLQGALATAGRWPGLRLPTRRHTIRIEIIPLP